jgi:hypothetical protein
MMLRNVLFGVFMAVSALAAEASTAQPAAREWRLEMEHTGGWGAGKLAEFKLDFEGNYEFAEWAFEKRGAEKNSNH